MTRRCKKASPFIVVLLLISMMLPVFAFNHNDVMADTMGVTEFVQRLYTVTLHREADDAGLAYWVEKLSTGKATGVSVAYGFIFSEEFQAEECSNDDYVEYMYEAFFGRASDEAGKQYYLERMNNGTSRESLFSGFANSVEFYNLCNSYGIVTGTYVMGKNVHKVAKVNLFLERLYQTLLSRSCDKDGMVYWTNKLVMGTTSGAEVTYGFLFSDEYRAKNKTSEEILCDMYVAMMGREADDAGKAYWMRAYNNGYTDLRVFNYFVVSTEFTDICNSYGIVRGDMLNKSVVWARNNMATPTPRPTATNTPRPTATNTPRPTATSTPRPTSSVNRETSCTVYFLASNVTSISIPSGYETSHRIVAAPGATFRTNSSNIQVNSNGVVSPKATTWYWRNGFGTTARPSDMTGVTVVNEYSAGTYTVTVTDSTGSYNVTVNVKNYLNVYVDNEESRIISQIITAGMTGQQKVNAITRYVAEHYSYSASYSSASGMILNGCGDCWASSYLIIDLCQKAGIRAMIHNANWQSGAGSGHRNVIAEADGVIYELDSGYTGTAPRYYKVSAYTEGYRISSNGIISEYVSLDPINGAFVIPETVGGITVTGFSRSFLFDTVQATNSTITSITIPKTVNRIADQSFYIYNESLTAINVAAGNTSYKSVNGIVYTKDGKTLVAVPHGYTFANGTFNIPSGVTSIMGYAVSYVPGLRVATIPSGCTTVGEGAFFACRNLTTLTLPNTLVTISDGAFNSLSALTQITIPSSVRTIGQAAFYGNSSLTVTFRTSTVSIGSNAFSDSSGVTFVGASGSTAQSYASTRNIVFRVG